MAPPSPPAEALITTVRSSCHSCRSHSNVSIDDEAIMRFLRQLPKQQFLEIQDKHGAQLPLIFDNATEQLNVIAILSLLNFLSGYRAALHALTGRGAFSTVVMLVMSLHLSTAAAPSSSPRPLSAEHLARVSTHDLAQLMQVTLFRETPHPTLGSAVQVGDKDETAFEIVELVRGVLNQTGEILLREKCTSLGEWVQKKLVETGADPGKLVKALADTFPAFNDAHEVDGQAVYLYKKALYMVCTIALAFGSAATPPPFPLPPTEDLPVFVDNILPTMLLYHGIIEPPDGMTNASVSATILRAAALDACSVVVERAHKLASAEPEFAWMQDMRESHLDAWLWNETKRKELRDIERFAKENTIFF